MVRWEYGMAKNLILIIHHSYKLKSCSKLIITKMNEFSEDRPSVIIQGISQAANCGTRVSFFILFPPQAETDVKNSTNALSSNIRWWWSLCRFHLLPIIWTMRRRSWSNICRNLMWSRWWRKCWGLSWQSRFNSWFSHWHQRRHRFLQNWRPFSYI